MSREDQKAYRRGDLAAGCRHWHRGLDPVSQEKRPCTQQSAAAHSDCSRPLSEQQDLFPPSSPESITQEQIDQFMRDLPW